MTCGPPLFTDQTAVQQSIQWMSLVSTEPQVYTLWPPLIIFFYLSLSQSHQPLSCKFSYVWHASAHPENFLVSLINGTYVALS